MPGYRDCTSPISSPMVAALTSTTSSLFVNFLNGVGILTFFVIRSVIFLSVRILILILLLILFPLPPSRVLFFVSNQRLEFTQARFDFARRADVPVHSV